ncbi:hypothetical protein PENSPDRAFT_691027 [Peniophora sp. CONT]|nr:hypothetical protein PENSPDRAFT_691027 [Peniophora sp. CONT]
MSTVTSALPLIIARYGEQSIGIPRPTLHFSGYDNGANILAGISASPQDNGIRLSVQNAFPILNSTRYTLAAKLPGMQEPMDVVDSLWPRICATVAEVHVRVPLSDDDKRLKRLTELAACEITIKTEAGQKFQFNVNLQCATPSDLKRLVEKEIGVPVEQQLIIHTNENLSAGNDRNRCSGNSHCAHEILEGEVLVNCFVDPDDVLLLKIRPSESRSMDVVVRSRR